MKYARRLAMLVLLLCSALATAQVMFSPGSPRVEELRRLYAQSGLVFPTAGFPVSEHTLAGFAADLDPGLPGYSRPDIEIALLNRFSLEGYLKAGTPKWTHAWEEFVHEYLERENLWTLNMSWSRADRAGFVIEAFLHREYMGPAYTNLPEATSGNPLALENEQVSKGYFWYNFDPLQLEFGRDRVHFGPLRSSLLPSGRLPYLDMLRVTLPIGNLTMDWMVSSLENPEVDDQDLIDLMGPEEAEKYPFDQTIILANMHRFEYNFGRLRAAVSGFAVYARENNHYVLSDFFPVFSWHATLLLPLNLSLVFDLEAVVSPGLRLMTQFGFDDINVGGLGVGDSAIPTIFAGIAGAEYTRRLRSGPVIVLYAEGGYTHYLWGSFRDKWALTRALYRHDLDIGTFAIPLTSPYGPGTAWATVEGTVEGWRGLDLGLAATVVFRNPEADLTRTPYSGSGPASEAGLEGTLTLDGKARYRHRDWLEVYARPAWHYRPDASWLELVLGSTVNLDWRRPVDGRSPAEVRRAAAGD